MAQSNKNRKKFCIFCKDKIEPDYKEVSAIRRFITERGKIIPRAKSGLCARHGRAVSTAIKRARYMALLPFTEEMKS